LSVKIQPVQVWCVDTLHIIPIYDYKKIYYKVGKFRIYGVEYLYKNKRKNNYKRYEMIELFTLSEYYCSSTVPVFSKIYFAIC